VAKAKPIERIANISGLIAMLSACALVAMLLDVLWHVLWPSSHTTEGTVVRQEADRVVVSYPDRQGRAREESFPLEEQSQALPVGEKVKVHKAYRYKMSQRIYLEGQRWYIGELKLLGVVFLLLVIVPLILRFALVGRARRDQPPGEGAIAQPAEPVAPADRPRD
jgi:hypothetical protein